MNFLMAEDLREFYVVLQKDLSEGEYLKDLEPEFQVYGSMEEGTRLGLANELDIGMSFKALTRQPPFRVDMSDQGDPFSLRGDAHMMVALRGRG